jgi:hypothetical protein
LLLLLILNMRYIREDSEQTHSVHKVNSLQFRTQNEMTVEVGSYSNQKPSYEQLFSKLSCFHLDVKSSM